MLFFHRDNSPCGRMISAPTMLNEVRWLKNSIPERYICAQRPGGVHRGGRLEIEVETEITASGTIDFTVSAAPMPLSLVTFLCGHKKVTRLPKAEWYMLGADIILFAGASCHPEHSDSKWQSYNKANTESKDLLAPIPPSANVLPRSFDSPPLTLRFAQDDMRAADCRALGSPPLGELAKIFDF